MWLFLVSLVAQNSHAAGYYTSDVGVRAFSRGGAYVAGPSDLLALWYNPAALTRLGDGQLTVDVAGVMQSVYFDRQDYPGEGPLDAQNQPTDLVNDPISNSAPPYLIPHLGASWSFGLPNTVFAIGFYPPYAPDLSYPKDGPQRYSLVDTLIIQTFTGASVAHHFADWVSVGAGVSWNYLKVEQELAVSVPQNNTDPTANEDAKYDVRFGMAGKDSAALGWNAGLLVEPPSHRWAVGAMFQAPVRFQARGTMNADFRDNYFRTDEYFGIIAADTAADPDVGFDVSMPPIVKLGALVRPRSNIEIELATVWEGWSVIQEIELTDVNMTVPLDKSNPIVEFGGLEDISITDNIVLPAGYRDTWSVRLGGEWRIHNKATLRMGGQWEQGAIPDANRGVSLLDGNKWGYGLGGTFQANSRIGLDFGWFQSIVPETTITDSNLKSIVIDWQTGAIVEGRTIGNGTLRGSAMMFGAGLVWSFGRHPEQNQTLADPAGRFAAASSDN